MESLKTNNCMWADYNFRHMNDFGTAKRWTGTGRTMCHSEARRVACLQPGELNIIDEGNCETCTYFKPVDPLKYFVELGEQNKDDRKRNRETNT